LLAQLEAGVLSTAYLMQETDPTLAVIPFLERLRVLAQRIKAYQQQKQKVSRRMRPQDERQLKLALAVEHLAHMALGVLASEGVLQQRLPNVGSLADLVCYVAEDKGGMAQLLHDKWCKTYKVAPSCHILASRAA
jgi:hypothetical protein